MPIKKTALVLVDFQSDFTKYKHGTLAVPGTNREYIEQVTEAVDQLINKRLPTYATQDWHPHNHTSFYSNHSEASPFETREINGRSQILWPPHCVQKTPGAKILINTNLFNAIIQKGMNPSFDSYSGFADDGGKKTGLEKLLRQDKIEQLIIFGLATDYCVKATALDANKAGFAVQVRVDLCRGVAPETTEIAISEMQSHGIQII